MKTMMYHNSGPMGIDPVQDEAQSADEATVFRYVQWNVNDYLAGTARMTVELEGVYMRFLMQLYSNGKPLPDDDTCISKLLRLSLRVWRRVKLALTELGKIVIRNKSLTNSRFEIERQRRAEDHKKRADAAHKRWSESGSKASTSSKPRPKIADMFAQVSEKNLEKPNDFNDTPVKEHMLTKNQNPESNKKEESSSGRLSDSELLPLLERAAGACLKSAAVCPGLLVLRTPRNWLEQGGCDLHLDVLPVLKAVGMKRPMRSVNDWSYFTNAIAEAKAKRTAPMPTADPEAAAAAKFAAREKFIRQQAGILGISTDEYRKRVKAREQA